MFEKSNAKEPNDFLAQISEIMSRHSMNLSGAPSSTPSTSKADHNVYASVAPIMEAMTVVSKAQLALREREMELAAVQAELGRQKTAVTAAEEKCGTLTNSFAEIKNENIQVIAAKEALATKVASLEADIEAKEEAKKSELETATIEIGRLKNELQAKIDEFEAFKVSAQAAGAEVVGAGEEPKGDREANVEELAAEEVADKIVDASKSDQEKIEEKFAKLQEAAHTKGGTHVKRYAEFCKTYAKELGLPL